MPAYQAISIHLSILPQKKIPVPTKGHEDTVFNPVQHICFIQNPTIPRVIFKRQVFWLPQLLDSLPISNIMKQWLLICQTVVLKIYSTQVTAADPLPILTGFPIKFRKGHLIWYIYNRI